MTPDLPLHSVSVTAVVLRTDGRVLAIRRRDDGRWVPPGGVVERDETLEQAVMREVLEETSVRVEPGALTGVYKNMLLGVVSLGFRCRTVSGDPRPTEEAVEGAWLTIDQVTELMPEARAVRVLDALRNDGPFVRMHDGTSLL